MDAENNIKHCLNCHRCHEYYHTYCLGIKIHHPNEWICPSCTSDINHYNLQSNVQPNKNCHKNDFCNTKNKQSTKRSRNDLDCTHQTSNEMKNNSKKKKRKLNRNIFKDMFNDGIDDEDIIIVKAVNWKCNKCTFVNNKIKYKYFCEICGSKKTKEVKNNVELKLEKKQKDIEYKTSVNSKTMISNINNQKSDHGNIGNSSHLNCFGSQMLAKKDNGIVCEMKDEKQLVSEILKNKSDLEDDDWKPKPKPKISIKAVFNDMMQDGS